MKRAILIIAAGIAIIGFALIDRYNPVLGIIGNVINGKISVPLCSASVQAPGLPPDFSLDSTACVSVIPYKWVFAGAVGLAVLAVLWPEKFDRRRFLDSMGNASVIGAAAGSGAAWLVNKGAYTNDPAWPAASLIGMKGVILAFSFVAVFLAVGLAALLVSLLLPGKVPPDAR